MPVPILAAPAERAGAPEASAGHHGGPIERASEALLCTDRTPDQIADELGLCDGFAVSRLALRVTGRRPSELRSLLRRTPGAAPADSRV